MTLSTPAGVGSAKKRGPYLTPKTVAVQPMVDVIRHHRIVSELSLGYVLQAIGFFRSDRSEKFRPSDVTPLSAEGKLFFRCGSLLIVTDQLEQIRLPKE